MFEKTQLDTRCFRLVDKNQLARNQRGKRQRHSGKHQSVQEEKEEKEEKQEEKREHGGEELRTKKREVKERQPLTTPRVGHMIRLRCFLPLPDKAHR